MATQSDLAKAVLQDLGVLAAGETASAEDNALVQERIGQVHEELVDNGLVSFTLAAIPSKVMRPMSIIVAAECWRAYHGEDGVVVAEQKAAAARARLAQQAQRVNTQQPGHAVYY